MKYICLLFALLFFSTGSVSAETLPQAGIGQASYAGQSKKEARTEAIRNARMNALTRYASTFDVVKATNFNRIKPFVEVDLDRFFIDYVIVDEVQDKEHEFFRVEINAHINVNALEQEMSKVAGATPGSSAEKSNITFVFVARQAKEVKQFDTRRTLQRKVEVSDEESESSSVESGAVGRTASRAVGAKVTVGGSRVNKADEILWDVSTVNEIDTAMNNVFTMSGYEVINAVDVYDASGGKLDSETFRSDYKSGDDISAETRRNAIAGCREADLDYFATGTLDIGMSDIEPATGLSRVYVSVTGKVLSLRMKFPKVVASVGPVQVSGLGPDPRVAKLNALKAAGEQAARELTSQLRMKGVQ